MFKSRDVLPDILLSYYTQQFFLTLYLTIFIVRTNNIFNNTYTAITYNIKHII